MENWQAYSPDIFLKSGDLVKIRDGVSLRGCRNQGTVIRIARKNYIVSFDGREFSVPPSIIAEFSSSQELTRKCVDFPLAPQLEPQHPQPVCHPELVQIEVKEGDVVLMYRKGPNDLVKVLEVTHNRIKGINLANGKTYRWDHDAYVQKLDSTRFS